jgi:low temperature requirement protein LtrA
VERHGLIVIIALGESIVAIGVGIGSEGALTKTLVEGALLGLVLSFLLWWVYFGGDDVKAEHALEGVPDLRRARVALHAFGWAHVPLLYGIIAFAAGVKKATGHVEEHIYMAQALVLGGGVAIFLLGDVLFRAILHIGTLRYRVIAAFAALATIPLGVKISAISQLIGLVLVMTALLVAEWSLSTHADGREAVHGRPVPDGSNGG